MPIEQETVRRLFTETHIHEPPSDNKRDSMIAKWQSELSHIVDRVSEQPHMSSLVIEETRSALDAWVNHKDHGAQHSYAVYEGMVWLAQQDGTWSQDQDSTFQALAVLHDLSQILPFKDPVTGNPLNGDQRKAHAKAMSVAIRFFGGGLGLQKGEVNDLARSIRHHDDEYLGKHYPFFSRAGMILADADKLFGAGLSRDPKQLAADAIARNQQGASRPDGWYLLRDLTKEQRDNWQYGDRWLSDRVSAVRMDMIGIQFYTETGKRMAKERRDAFLEQAHIAYGKEYDDTKRAVDLWNTAIHYGRSISIQLVGKNSKGVDPLTEHIEYPYDVDTIIAMAYEKRLNVKTRADFDNPKGWKIQATIEGNSVIIDSSIARFSSKSDFLLALRKACT